MADGLLPGARLVVRRGAPGDEELVAVLLAIDAAVAADRPATTPPRRPAWTVAARQEGVGGAALATRSSLRGWGAA